MSDNALFHRFREKEIVDIKLREWEDRIERTTEELKKHPPCPIDLNIAREIVYAGYKIEELAILELGECDELD